MLQITWHEVFTQIDRLYRRNRQLLAQSPAVYGVPTGGSIVAALLQQVNRAGIRLLDRPVPGCLVVDDIIDSGRTLQPYLDQGYAVDTLYRSMAYRGQACPGATRANQWVGFPWEHNGEPRDAVVRLLQFVGLSTENWRVDNILNAIRKNPTVLAGLEVPT